MVKISQALKLLSTMNPNSTQGRLCFHNYLSYFCDHEEALRPEIVEDFISHTLDYVHWLQNRQQLTQELRSLLEAFSKIGDLEYDFSKIQWPVDIQVIDIESAQNWVEVLQSYLPSQTSPAHKFRLIHDEPSKKILAIILNPDGSLVVRQFDRKFIVSGGQLIPLRRNITLHYNPDMELDVTHRQRIEVAPFVTAQFSVFGEKITGGLLRGYLAQKFFELKGEPMEAYPKLFYSVKRIESFFIDRRSDAFYAKLLQNLERTNALVRVNDPEAVQSSIGILSQSQNALEHVFVGDKLLSLLIRDLQNNLGNRRVGSANGIQIPGQNGPLASPLANSETHSSWKILNQNQAQNQTQNQKTTKSASLAAENPQPKSFDLTN